MRLYVDGVLQSSAVKTGTIANYNQPLHIGRLPSGNYLDGWVDAVAVYSSALSAAEVAQRYGGQETYDWKVVFDNGLPTLDPPPPPDNRWYNGSASLQTTLTGHDPISGVKLFKLFTPRQGGGEDVQTQTDPNCSDAIANLCPTDPPPKTVAYSTSGMPEGASNTVRAVAQDAVTNESAARTWTLKVDKTAALIDVAPTTTAPYLWFKPGQTYNFSADTSDGLSGVEKIDFYVNNQLVQSRPGDNCSSSGCDPNPPAKSFSWIVPDPYNAPNAPEADLKLIATDKAGNPSAAHSWKLRVDDDKPTAPVISGTLKGAENKAVKGSSFSLHVEGADGSTGNPSSGMKQIKLFGGPDAGPLTERGAKTPQSCPENCTQTWDTTFSPLPSDESRSPRRVRAQVDDQVANTSDSPASPSSLVSYWRLNETSGTQAADGKGLNHGTYTGGYTLNEPGATTDGDRAVRFNGSTGYVAVPHSPTLNFSTALTVETWVRPASQAPNQYSTVISKPFTARAEPYNEFALNTNAGAAATAEFQLATGGVRTSLGGTTTLPTDRYSHLVGTWNGAVMRLYVDGVLQSSTAKTGTITNYNQPLHIGRLPSGNYLDGWVDEVALYSSTLTPAEVAQRYRGNEVYDWKVVFDNGLPTLDPPPPPDNRWYNGSASLQTSLTGHDPISGVKLYKLFTPKQGGGEDIQTQTDTTCSDSITNLCPTDPPAKTVTYSTSGMPDSASNTVRAVVQDAVTNESAARTWTLKVDKTAPAEPVATGEIALDGDWIGPDDTALRVDATDELSGVKSLELHVDGAPHGDPKVATCGATCPSSFSADFEWNHTNAAEGAHSLKVVVYDLAGNKSERTWTVNLDRLTPLADVEGSLWGADGRTIPLDDYDIVVNGVDDVPEGVASSGIRSIEVRLNGTRAFYDECTSGCSTTMERTWQYRPSADGVYTFEAIVTDLAGNVDRDTIEVTFVHVETLPPYASDVDGDPAVVINGGATGDQAGTSVANAGDVNDDGFDDYLVGSPGVSVADRSGSGAAYLVFGSDDTTPVTLGDPPSGPNPRFLRFLGAESGDRAGFAVAAGGDVNGDGYPDLLIGAPGPPDLSQVVAAEVYVVFGGPNVTSLDLGQLGSNGFVIRGPVPQVAFDPNPVPQPSSFGGQLANRRLGEIRVDGDVNGDGLDDIVIGAAADASLTRPGAGATYVIFGKETSDPVDLVLSAGDPGSNGFKILGAEPFDRAGQSTALIGDVNADNLADVLVTAPGADALGRSAAGSAYVVFGKENTQSVDLAILGSAGFAVSGASGDNVTNASGLGDVDGDERDDLFLGGSSSWVVLGQAAPAGADLAGAFPGYEIQGLTGTGYERAEVAGVADVDGDDSPDGIVSYPSAEGGAGVAYLVLGRPLGGNVSLASLRGDQGTRMAGPAGSGAGQSADGVDAEQESEPAVVVGAPQQSSGRGAVYAKRQRVSAARHIRKDCYRAKPRTKPYAFPYPGKTPVPACRYSRRDVLDVLLSKKRPYNQTFSPYGGGNARYKGVRTLRGDRRGKLLPLYDSWGNEHEPFAYVRENYDGCWGVFDAQSNHVGDTYTGEEAGCAFGSDPKPRPADPAKVYTRAQLEVQGRACMKSKALEDDYVVVALASGLSSEDDPNRTEDGTYIGLRGFMRRSNLEPDGRGRQLPSRVDKAYARCGRYGDFKRMRRQVVNTSLPRNPFDRDPENGVRPDLYQGRRSVASCGTRPGCGGNYANYQGPDWVDDIALLPYVTTGVNGGGIVRAVVRRRHATDDSVPVPRFWRYDAMGYSDPNVPCGQQRVAAWWFGNGNPGAENDRGPGGALGTDPDNQPMFGWSAIKNVEGGARSC
jgi:hypothetical protein